MNFNQETVLKLTYAGFTTRHLHKMLRYDTSLNFINDQNEFLNFISKSNFNYNKMIEIYNRYRDSDIEKLVNNLKAQNIKFVFSNQPGYPNLLKQIYDYPLMLFGQGDMNLLNHSKMLSIVGSRKATTYTEQICDTLIPSLVKANITIVSGLAMGADYFAHLKTIDQGGHTIGVAAFGLNYHYPKSTDYINLFMREHHLVISEYYPNVKLQKWRFPERNRIISGLSQGVLVTEANERSGSLITIDQALEQNRNVYCCPGTIFQSLSKGVNKRIQEGAKLIQTPEDILEDFR